jgi:thioredoxin-related protein
MQESKVKNQLEVITAVAVLLAAMAVLSALSWGYFVQRAIPSLQSGLQRGEFMPKLQNVDYSSSSQTLLLVMNTECHFCTESIPFYNQLAQSQTETSGSTHMIAIFPNQGEKVKQYTQKNRLQIDAVPGVDLRAFNISSTPTMILVDGSGKILDFWIGKLSEDTEREVLKAVAISEM